MLAGLTAPSLILSGAGGVNLPVDLQQYCVSAVLIFCAFGTSVYGLSLTLQPISSFIPTVIVK